MLVEKGSDVGCILNINPATVGPYGLWLWSMSAGQRGGECYTLAVNVEMGPVFHSHSSQMPLYSVPPPFIPPPPLSSSNKWSFCSRVFAAVGRRASAGLSPKTSGRMETSCPLTLSFVAFLCCVFYTSCTLFSLSFLLFHNSSSHPLQSPQPLSSPDIQAGGFSKFLPSPLLTYCSTFFHQKPLLSSRPLTLLPFLTPFHPLNMCRDA